MKKSFSGVELSDDICMVFGIDLKSMIFFCDMLPYNVSQTYQREKRRGVATIKAAKTISMTQTTRALWCDIDEQNLSLTHLCDIVSLT